MSSALREAAIGRANPLSFFRRLGLPPLATRRNPTLSSIPNVPPRPIAMIPSMARREIARLTVSGNYRYKLGRGVLRKIGESAYKRNFLEMSLKPWPIT